jgi:hypothetical protein
MRRFFLEYRRRLPRITQTLSGQLAERVEKNYALSKESPSWQKITSDAKKLVFNHRNPLL